MLLWRTEYAILDFKTCLSKRRHYKLTKPYCGHWIDDLANIIDVYIDARLNSWTEYFQIFHNNLVIRDDFLNSG